MDSETNGKDTDMRERKIYPRQSRSRLKSQDRSFTTPGRSRTNCKMPDLESG
jgi:hypothetical protein